MTPPENDPAWWHLLIVLVLIAAGLAVSLGAVAYIVIVAPWPAIARQGLGAGGALLLIAAFYVAIVHRIRSSSRG